MKGPPWVLELELVVMLVVARNDVVDEDGGAKEKKYQQLPSDPECPAPHFPTDTPSILIDTGGQRY